jgi:hypothetical protein
MGRSRRTALLAAAGVAALAAAGCGAEDHPNDPRPPAPIELSAKVDNQKVVVSPDKVGAGLADVTIANLNDDDVNLTFVGPADQAVDPILAGGITSVKLNLEQGRYELRSDDDSLKPGILTVGPERPSAQNDLLLP